MLSSDKDMTAEYYFAAIIIYDSLCLYFHCFDATVWASERAPHSSNPFPSGDLRESSPTHGQHLKIRCLRHRRRVLQVQA